MWGAVQLLDLRPRTGLILQTYLDFCPGQLLQQNAALAHEGAVNSIDPMTQACATGI